MPQYQYRPPCPLPSLPTHPYGRRSLPLGSGRLPLAPCSYPLFIPSAVLPPGRCSAREAAKSPSLMQHTAPPIHVPIRRKPRAKPRQHRVQINAVSSRHVPWRVCMQGVDVTTVSMHATRLWPTGRTQRRIWPRAVVKRASPGFCFDRVRMGCTRLRTSYCVVPRTWLFTPCLPWSACLSWRLPRPQQGAWLPPQAGQVQA